MKKNEIMAALFSVFVGTDKAISELADADKRTAFEAEIEALAEQIEQKEATIASQAVLVSIADRTIETVKAEGKAALDLATEKLVKAENELAAAQSELSAFGATAEERNAYAAEHATLTEFYNEKKAGIAPKGADVTGAKVETEASDKPTLSEREAKIEAFKKDFPNSLGNY